MQTGCEGTLEELYAIKFSFKLLKNATVTYGMLQTAFGASCMIRVSVFEWHKRFKEGRESVRDDERCGRVRKFIDQSLLAKGLGLGLLTSGQQAYHVWLRELLRYLSSNSSSRLFYIFIRYRLPECSILPKSFALCERRPKIPSPECSTPMGSVYIVIHRQTVSFYPNSSLWLDT